MDWSLAFKFFVALAIGGLIGLERQHSTSAGLAGSRTFPLVALLGAVAQTFFLDQFTMILILLLAVIVSSYVAKIMYQQDLGITTAIALLVTFLLGALATRSEQGTISAVVLGTVVTVLLASKGPLHTFARQLEQQELEATLKFLIVSLVVLPLLPNREMDMLLGLNPRFIWLMVVFVSGISFAAYILTRLLGTQRGLGITGILGGFVSSTATMLSMSERSRQNPYLENICALAAVLASLTMFPRALIEIAVVNRELVTPTAVPLGSMTVLGLVFAGFFYWKTETQIAPEAPLKNPFRLQPALLFGGFFALIMLCSEKLHLLFGNPGVYITSLASGLVDVDAMALSLSKLAREGDLSPLVATRGILLVTLSNTAVKIGIAVVMGTRRLALFVGAGLGAPLLLGLGFLFWI